MHVFGFIGFGSMGSMLVKGFVESGAISPDSVYVTRKDKSRLGDIKAVRPGIHTTENAWEVAEKADFIFICVKPLEYRGILGEIGPFINPDKHIISIAGSVTIKDLESFADCKITKLLPAIVNEVNEGVSLVCHSSRVNENDAAFIESLIAKISRVKRIAEKDFGLASELTSCGPGFIAAIFQEFVQTALQHTDSLEKEEAEEMVLQTLFGTARLMLEKRLSFEEVMARVATKGGITEEGVKIIKRELPQVFEELFSRTMEKRRRVGEKVEKDFWRS